MASESARYDPAATLPPHRAFVVHFGTTGRRGRRVTGRVEHLSSGTFTHFTSLRGLLRFFARFLGTPEESDDKRSCDC
jgi:hypothetical protein